MARPREFDQDDVLDKVVEVFWSRGFEATSIQDLEGATGLKRGSLYNAFGDKATLFREAFDHYLKNSAVRRALAAHTGSSGKEAINAVLDAVVAEGATDSKGCLITNTATELAGRDTEVAAFVGQAVQDLQDKFDELCRRAQNDGDLTRGADPRALARFLAGVVQGMRVMSKVDQDGVALRDIAESTKVFLWRNDPEDRRSQGFFGSLFGK